MQKNKISDPVIFSDPMGKMSQKKLGIWGFGPKKISDPGLMFGSEE